MVLFFEKYFLCQALIAMLWKPLLNCTHVLFASYAMVVAQFVSQKCNVARAGINREGSIPDV